MAVAPQHPAIGQALFWVAIIVPFMIFLTMLMVARLGSLRVVIVAILGLYPAVIYRLSSPLVLGGYDEHLHEQEVLNLLRGSGLFAANPILRAGPYYPGLEIFTGVVIRLTGLSAISVMSVVVLLCRLLLVLLIYYGALLVSPSRRGASLVVAFYATCSQFYAFNSQFSYQTLALTLGLGGLVLLRRAQFCEGIAIRRHFFVASLLLAATVVTHHVTSWLVLAFLIVWAVLTSNRERKILAHAAIVMGAAVVIWTGVLVAPIVAYFGPVLSSIVQSVQAFLSGTSGHHVFGASGGTPPAPDWERAVLAVYTVSCTVAALVCAWILISRAFHNRDRMVGFLGALDLMFPITGAAHFDPGVGALGDRASTFLFFPLALSCSLIICRSPRVARRPVNSRNYFRPAVLAALIGGTTFIYLGGTLLGSNADWDRLPGPYLVSAEARTQDPETIAAVRWAAENIPAGSTVVADRIPGVLLASQARLWPVFQPRQNLEPALLYFSDTWGPEQTAIVKGLHIDYLYVDSRLADSLPYIGQYITNGETQKPTRITTADIIKFAHVRGLRAVYHHGPVTIYSTYNLGVTPEWNGFRGYHSMGTGSLDAVFGALIVFLGMLIRKRLAWIPSTARDVGVLGTVLAIIAVSIFLGGALFAARLMPGPAFTFGVITASIVILAVKRRMDVWRLIRRVSFPRSVDPLILLGVIAGIAGLVIAIHGAWITDVADVNAILRVIP